MAPYLPERRKAGYQFCDLLMFLNQDFDDGFLYFFGILKTQVLYLGCL